MTVFGLHVPALLLGHTDWAADRHILTVLLGNVETFLDRNSFRNWRNASVIKKFELNKMNKILKEKNLFLITDAFPE